ncbi:MAG: ABC transporter ATP-binding protein [Hyphomicrobiaceae bacterium]
MSAPLLSVAGLTVHYAGRGGGRDRALVAVDDASFDLAAGEILSLVGESGAGKSTVAYALMRLIDPPGRIVAGRATFEGRDLLALDEAAMRAVRGNRICMVFQDPMATLNPLMRVGDHIAEGLMVHRGLGRQAARRRAVAALTEVGIPAAERRARDYPHEMSGGMQQRAVIAAALAMEPALLIADEPTTALDATIQSQIMDLLVDLTQRHGTALLLVTHNIALVAETADQIAVMYGGTIVEIGPKGRVLDAPRHPYTAALVGSIPRLDEPDRPLTPIPGMMPGLAHLPEGCPFHPRCAQARLPDCRVRPALLEAGPGHRVACHFALEPPA